MVSLSMVVLGERRYRSPQGRLAEQNQPRQAFLFTDRTHLSANAFKFGLLDPLGGHEVHKTVKFGTRDTPLPSALARWSAVQPSFGATASTVRRWLVLLPSRLEGP